MPAKKIIAHPRRRRLKQTKLARKRRQLRCIRLWQRVISGFEQTHDFFVPFRRRKQRLA